MRNIKIGSLLGIPILINPSWFFLLAFVTWILAADIYPAWIENRSNATYAIMSGLTVVMFFVSIVLHELAHSAVARGYQIPVKSITLFIFGGVAQITREAKRPLAELLMAAAGPLTSLVLGGVFLLIWWAIGAGNDRPLEVVFIWLGLTNIVLGVFNMVPAFPMDGGRVFRSLIWMISGNYFLATTIAAWTGRFIAWAMIAVGILGAVGVEVYVTEGIGSLWLAFMGFFLENAARQSLVQSRIIEVLRRYRADDVMLADPTVVEASMTIASLARGVLEVNPRVCYFVEDAGKLAGILSSYQMLAVPQSEWDRTTAGEAMIPTRRLHAVAPEKLVSDVLREMENDDLTHLPVVRDGRVVGVVGRDRIIGVLRNEGLLGGRA